MPFWKQFATDQTDPWQVVPRQAFTPYDTALKISVAFVVLCRVGCLWVTGVKSGISIMSTMLNVYDFFLCMPLKWVYMGKYVPNIYTCVVNAQCYEMWNDLQVTMLISRSKKKVLYLAKSICLLKQ